MYTITFNSNGGTTIADLTEQTALPNPLPTTTKSGYKFVAWYYESNFQTRAKAGDTIEANTTLYAKWHNLGTLFAGIANAIRSKDGTSGNIRDLDFDDRIRAIEPAKEEETKTVTPNFSSGSEVVTPTTGKVLSQVTINKDSNLIADNIKKDVTVHGITGTLVSGGGISLTNLPFFEYTVGTGTNNQVMYLLVSAMWHDGKSTYFSGITVKNSSDNAIFNIKSHYYGVFRISTDGGSSWTSSNTPFALIKLNLKDTIKPYLEYFNETPYPLAIYKYRNAFGAIDYEGTPSQIEQVSPENGKYYFQEIYLGFSIGSIYFLIVDLKLVDTD